MQTRATTSTAIAALRSLLRGDPSALDRTASAASSFQVLALRLTTATPQTVPTSQQRETLSRELSALSADRDARVASAANFIRAAMQAYSLASSSPEGSNTRQNLEAKAQRALAQAQRELDAIEQAEQAEQASGAEGPDPTRRPPLTVLPSAQGGQTSPDLSGRPLPSIPPPGQRGGGLRPAARQGATPRPAAIPNIPAPVVIEPVTGRIPAAVMQPLRQRMAQIAQPPAPPETQERNNAQGVLRGLLQEAFAGTPLSAGDLASPSELMMNLSYLVSYDLAALRIDDSNPGRMLYSLPHLVKNSPSGIASDSTPLRMLALLLKTLRELTNTENGRACLGPLVARLNSVIGQPIPNLTLIDSQPPSGEAAKTRAVTLDELLLSALSAQGDGTKTHVDFENLADMMDRALDNASQDKEEARKYLKFYLVSDNSLNPDADLNAAIEAASASVLTQLRYVIECFVQGFYAMDPERAAAIFPLFAAGQPIAAQPPRPFVPSRRAPPPPRGQRPQTQTQPVGDDIVTPLPPQTEGVTQTTDQAAALPTQSATGMNTRYHPLGEWRTDWPADQTDLIDETIRTLRGAFLEASQPEAAFNAMDINAQTSLARGMEQILATTMDPIGLRDHLVELEDLLHTRRSARQGDPFVVPAGQPRVLTQLYLLLRGTQELARVTGNTTISEEVDDILATCVTAPTDPSPLYFSAILQEDRDGGEFSDYMRNIFGMDEEEVRPRAVNMLSDVSNVLLAIARARITIRALIKKILNGDAINLPAKTDWRPDDFPDAGAATSILVGGTRASSLVFTQPKEQSQSGQPRHRSPFRRFFRRLDPRSKSRDKAASTSDLTASGLKSGTSLPDLSKVTKAKRGLFSRFKKPKSDQPAESGQPAKKAADDTPQISALPAAATTVLGDPRTPKVITQGNQAWNYPDYQGPPITSHKNAAISGFMHDPSLLEQRGYLLSDALDDQTFGVRKLLEYQKAKVNIDPRDLAPYDRLRHRFKDVIPVKSTQIDTPSGKAVAANQMVVDGKVVGLACSIPHNHQLAEMYNFMFESGMQGVHVLLREKELTSDTDDLTRYFDPIITPLESPHGYQINENSHQMQIDVDGIETSGGKLKVEKVVHGVFDQDGDGETKVIDLLLTRDGETRTVRVLHSTNWYDMGDVNRPMLERLLELRETCFENASPDRILTHCRAGVGRTGTLLAAEVMHHMPGSTVLDIVMSLRDSRSLKMVQSDLQMQLVASYAQQIGYPLFEPRDLDS